MKFATNISPLNELETFQIGEIVYIWLADFVQWLEKYRLPTDIISKVRRDNIQVELKRYNGLTDIDGKKAVKCSVVLKYIFNHTQHFKVCEVTCDQIVRTIVHDKSSDDQSSTLFTLKDLYSKVSKFCIRDPAVECWIFKQIEFKDIEIPTLEMFYKNDFNGTEWNRICIFEWHYYRSVYVVNETYEQHVQKKWKFWQQLVNLRDLNEKLSSLNSGYIERVNSRKSLAEDLDGFTLSIGRTHLPSKIEAQLMDYLKSCVSTNLSVTHIACLGCCPKLCEHSKQMHLYINVENPDTSTDDLNSIAVLVKSFLSRFHDVRVADIYFLSGDLAIFECSNCGLHRYKLRDELLSGQMNDIVIFRHLNKDDHDEQQDVSEGDLCQTCFDSVQQELDWRTFNITQEWVLQVPIIIQILFESFINKNTMRRLKVDSSSFLTEKLARLYTTYDTALNTFNREYFGIMQQLFTEELVVNYHHPTTVFSVTSCGGLTQSLSKAERKLKKLADQELCYYTCYHRLHPLKYQSVASLTEEIHHVNLRMCHLIIYLDNLVRLTKHDDPEPGQSRTAQLDTLPKTVKGLPKDSIVTTKWHGKDCDGSTDCQCKKITTLQKQDLQHALLTPRPEEAAAYSLFNIEKRWGMARIWDAICDLDEVKKQSSAPDSIEGEITNLDVTFSSLHLDESLDDHEDTFPNEQNEEEETGTPASRKRLFCLDEEHDSDREDSIKSLSSIMSDEEDEYSDCSFGLRHMPSEDSLEARGTNEADTRDDPLTDEDDDDSGDDVSDGVLAFLDHISTEASLVNQDLHNPESQASTDTSEVVKKDQDEQFWPFHPPELLCKHPPPAIGRDDDEKKLREILEDFLVCSGYPSKEAVLNEPDRILFAPDHKIGNNLLKLMSKDNKFKIFLPEFPMLHLRKSKITNVISGYRDAGLLHLIKYMKDEEMENDWVKLINHHHIETATRVVRRLSLALHISFLIRFLQCLPADRSSELRKDLQSGNVVQLGAKWDRPFEEFIQEGKGKNGTFALHANMMQHCDEVSAIAAAERMGGEVGYNLLLHSIKSSLPFAFLNGASSYASYCTQLLYQHYSAGEFHQNLKKTLYTTPHKGSLLNIGLDAQREMDHQDDIKGFRPRATIDSVVPRISLTDRMVEVIARRKEVYAQASQPKAKVQYHLGEYLFSKVSKTDMNHVLPTASLILRRNALSTESDSIPRNVYDNKAMPLNESILDESTKEIGDYLIKRYAAQQGFFGMSEEDLPSKKDISGPKTLVNRVVRAKSITIRRTKCKQQSKETTVEEQKEKKRQLIVRKEKTVIECLSSEMNTCQALVKPDGSKPKVSKAGGIKTALIHLLGNTIESAEGDQRAKTKAENNELMEKKVLDKGLVYLQVINLPMEISSTIKVATVEFAGVKFKTKAKSGVEYLNQIQTGVINKTLQFAPHAQRVIICEEKYKFTPDDFKAGTRAQRTRKEKISISHLKTADEMLSASRFSKEAVISTMEGKSLISSYLAKHLDKLAIRHDLILDVDSEAVLSTCSCNSADKVRCSCIHAIPIRAVFRKDSGYQGQHLIPSIKQRKGEAECSQMDWLADVIPDLQEGDAVLSIVSSGDIDSIILHLFAVTLHWPRLSNGRFKHAVYVILQKKTYDVYNITAIIEHLESTFEPGVAINIALALSLGGNDFIPRFYSISHQKILELLTTPDTKRLMDLFTILRNESGNITGGMVNHDKYVDMVKHLYCSKLFDPEKLSAKEVRQISIKNPSKKKLNDPRKWMPPITALTVLTRLINCYIDYLFTLWTPSGTLPNFLDRGFLKRRTNGDIDYDFGPDTRVEEPAEHLDIQDTTSKEKMDAARIRKAKRVREPDTPQGKQRKRRPLMSTPKSKQ